MGTVITTGLQVGSSLLQKKAENEQRDAEAKARADAARYQADIAKRNQRIAGRAAKQSWEDSQVEASDNDLRNMLQIGAVTAGQGGSGLATGSASFIKTRRTMRKVANQEADRIIATGLAKYKDIRRTARNYGEQSRLLLQEADRAENTGDSGYLSTILGAVAPIDFSSFLAKGSLGAGAAGAGGLSSPPVPQHFTLY